MEPFINKKYSYPGLFLRTGLLLLSIGLIFGLTGALQYILLGFIKQYISFEKIRPLHVSSVVFWIILGAIGSVLSYVQQHSGKKLHSEILLKIQFYIFCVSIISILISYFFGVFGGREYWEFNPLFALPIGIGWILFIINFVKTLGSFKNQPVYVWMWLTGIVFFLFTFLESYLWLFPYFSDNVVNDMTIQWKSYGSMVGSWNQLIYGSSIFLMAKISGDKSIGYSKISFALYFTGLTNLTFNWGHHIYTLPTHDYIKHISYIISMTELILIGRIIYKWRLTVSEARKHFHIVSFRFLSAADFWVFLTLLLAILMSIPGINVYTHGTHVTVAHTMGATIGINSFLLLAVAFDIFPRNNKYLSLAFWIANISLLIFWISLIIAGIEKAKWQMRAIQSPFSTMMMDIKPYFISFFISGLALIIALTFIILPLFKKENTRK
ncbi:MAG: cbb3-type cytochrome c oxidase subunit I [Bacteroidia bacterium]|nr:cbb3-type cytochrome c oxidase subunit I [Bacteroidia bacterium]